MAFALFKTPVTKQHGNIDIGAQHVEAAFAGDQANVHVRIGRVKAVQSGHQPVSGKGKIGGDLQHFMLLLCTDRT
ncbi:hypothetical protein D3C84_873340 [compost metagenome]